MEPDESYLDRYRIASTETSLISNILGVLPEVEREGVVSVAPRELPFPHLFKTG